MTRRRQIALALGFAGLALLVSTCRGRHEGPGSVHPDPVPAPIVEAREREQVERAAALGVEPDAKQILFGDLHVHTTFSPDAFLRSLPLVGGEGTHPPADACDYARFCSGLDFFAVTDHAEGLTHEHWRETIESIRDCNAAAGDPDDPDLAAFVGFEWTQVGATVDDHYGHKNVLFRGTADDELPARPIAAGGPLVQALRATQINAKTMWLPLIDGQQPRRYFDYRRYRQEIAAMPDCPVDVDVHQLPLDCREQASTPAELYAKLDQWGLDSLVIPHGTTWGFYTPPGYVWHELAESDERQRLIEVYSGHGNSEEWRSFSAAERVAGEWVCPQPTPEFEPCCWRAGELIRERCGDAPAATCEARVERARRLYLDAGVSGHQVVPGATVEDWGDCDQCRDCFNPSYSHRAGGSVQAILARGATFGMIASSDNHLARPGTGYKEFGRHGNTETVGARSPRFDGYFRGRDRRPTPEPERFDPEDRSIPPFAQAYLERQASFFMTGGLVAVHAGGRDRDSIWSALERREVYGTSGERILLWFDLVGGPPGLSEPLPMGSVVELPDDSLPRFRVRAAGSFEQLPGCPTWVEDQLSDERIHGLCLDECHNPADRRRAITRIEVVRIRPQQRPDEPIDALIEDPWQTFPCPADAQGCSIEFEDPEFAGGRTTLYYVRAIQEPTPAVNAGGLRCQGEACERLDVCYGDYRTEFDDECVSPNEERAWSSPIWLHPTRVVTP
ncbi:DUF3604 domain-containing protein [Nannocystaceae bacterium ST9]